MTGGKVTIFCDIKDGLRRAGVWRGKNLIDLYIDAAAAGDLTGAIVGGRVVRVMPGERTGFVECGLDAKVYITAPGIIRAGGFVVLQLTEPGRDGKAWRGEVLPNRQQEEKIDVLEDAPPAWRQAVSTVVAGELAGIVFGSAVELHAFNAWRAGQAALAHVSGTLDERAVEHVSLDEFIAALRKKRALLGSQGEVVIEKTEALTAIDVNGAEAGNALAVNLLAVKEVARQIRLRNLAGIILIDALKMKQRADNAKLLNALRRAVADDPAGVDVFGLTKLGLIEMTRRRRGASLDYYMQKAGA